MKFKLLIASLMVSMPVFAATPAPYKAGTYLIDPAHSKVGFEIAHLVISTVEGHFTKFDGSVVLADKFDKSSVKATADINSIDTGNPKRDDDLRSPNFFNATKFLKMNFTSKSLSGTPQAFKMNGDLTIKGITKPVTFDGKYLGMVGDGMGNEKVAFTAQAVIKRGDFGLKWNKMVEAGPVVGENVTILLRVEASRPAPKAPNGAAKPVKKK